MTQHSVPLHIVVMGVSAAGKSTAAQLLAGRLQWPLAEADTFHSPENKAKMHAGTPLTDQDRWPWLRSMADWMTEQARQGQSTVVTCSALKRSYRDLLCGAEGQVRFVYLHGSRDLLLERVSARQNHFMPAELLDSQLATLEPPQPDEQALSLDVAAPPEALVDHIIRRFKLS